MKLQLVNQDRQTNCIQACIAMLCGVSLMELEAKYGSMMYGHEYIGNILKEEGFEFEYVHGYEVEPGFIYLLDVPSLQQKAALHKIVLDFREEGVINILDPMWGVGEAYQPSFISEGMSLPFGNAVKVWRKGDEE